MSKGELGWLRCNRFASILSNLSIAGLLLLLFPLVVKLFAVVIMSIGAILVCIAFIVCHL